MAGDGRARDLATGHGGTMRITGWHIDGFGVFSGYAVEDLPPGLTIVLGPNEAGKSTLLAYLRSLLFGFADRRDPERSYAPVHGGRHGGRLFLADDNGAYTLERYRGARNFRLTLPDGREGAAADLGRLVGQADAEVFHNLFAFSLSELESLGTLDTNAVRERIFSAGVLGAGRSARQVMGKLDRRRELLLRPQIDGAEIPRLAERLRRLDERVAEAARVASGHEQVWDTERHWARELERLAGRLREERAAVERTSALLDLWPEWTETAEARRELDGLEVVEEVPEDIESRLERISGEVAGARTAYDDRRYELGELERQVDQLQPDNRLAAVAEDADALFVEHSAYQRALARGGEVERMRRQEQAELHEELARLGPEWDRERAAGLDRSIPTAEEVRALGADADRAAARHAQLDEDVERARAKVDTAAAEERRLQEALRRFSGIPGPERLDEQEACIRRLRAKLTDHGWASARYDVAARALEDLRVSARGAKSSLVGVPAWLRPALLVLGLLLVAGGVSAFLTDQLVVAAGTGASGFLLLALAALALRPVMRHPGPRATGARAAMQKHTREAAGEVETRRQAATRLREEVATLARQLDLPPLPAPLDVEERGALVTQHRESRRDADRLARALTEASAARRTAERHLTELRTDAQEAAAADREAAEHWVTWKVDHGVPAALSPQGVLDFFSSVERVRSMVRQLEATEAEAGEIERTTRKFEQRVAFALQTSGLDTPAGPDDLLSALTLLHERTTDDAALRRDRTNLQGHLADAESRLSAAEQRLKARIEARDEVFTLLGAADEEDARHRIGVGGRRAQLWQRLTRGEARIRDRLGEGPEADLVLEELPEGDLTGWRARREQARGELVRLEAEREEAVRRHHDAHQQVRALEESTDLPGLGLEREGVRQQLRDATAGWQRLTLARSLVLETLNRYQRERQPAVLARASELFAGVTAGRYEQVVISENGLDVVDRDGQRLDPGALSRGTAEQLYLCIRFGLAADFATQAAPLPLVLDDVLVNFDPERARGMATAIGSVAEDHQVLLFTCHPQIADMLLDARPGSRVIELQRSNPGPTEAAIEPGEAAEGESRRSG
ncbi:MAG: AAA family ATPase [Nitriliruptorales bacterium]|nr:AAA family ATPase [Nitriliruptorales bacterium]